MTAAPADLGESEITTDSTSSTFSLESTSTTFLPELTSTILSETSTTIIDARQNEVDANFSNGDEKMTTLSDVDKKIESIEADFAERSTVSQRVNDVDETTTEKEAVIKEKLLPDETVPEKISPSDESTTIFNKITQQPEDAEEIQEPKNNKEFERFVTESEESTKEDSTTMKIDPTSSTIATRVVLQQKPEHKSVMENPELTERAKALQQIKKMLKAHVLRAILTVLNEAKKRQIQEQHTSESQVVEEALYAFSGSECDCGENDDVSTDDSDKVIAFDKTLQRYVYKDKDDYELLKSDYVRKLN